MLRPLLIATATALAVTANVVPAQATVTTSASDVAVGTFRSRAVTGFSVFRETANGIRVNGSYRNLRANRAYFTVIYANGNCDPAQAFPVGPFVTDRRGRGYLNVTVAQPAAVDVGLTRSVSVRRGDNQTDIDGDGLLGPTDVVAVAGNPSVGLIRCDSSPRVF